MIYLHSDHLGSLSVATTSGGGLVSSQSSSPWGDVRLGGIAQTPLSFTGQRRDGTGLLFYNARSYDPVLGRFVSADSVVPGEKDNVVGRDTDAKLTPLTVDRHEPNVAGTVGAEDRLVRDKGVLAKETGRAGPEDPQALNRYAYVRGNPLRYTDPTGHLQSGCGGEPVCGGGEGGTCEGCRGGSESAGEGSSGPETTPEYTPSSETEPITAGESGRFGDLQARSSRGDELTPHHMPQAARNFTSRADGGALVMEHSEHVLTRIYGGRGVAVARQEAGMLFRRVLARDILDVRRIVGTKYNRGLLNLIRYYITRFPHLMSK